MTVLLTIDIDWAPDEVIKDTLDLLDKYNVTATFFATHKDGIDLGRHERALHPNFFDEGNDDRETIAELANLYPDASGIRSHGLYSYTNLREYYDTFNIKYESNFLLFGVEELSPFWMYPGVVHLPITFMDDMWLRRGRRMGKITQILDADGLIIFDFHPIHIYINTPSIDFYERWKEHYQEPSILREARHDGYGVRDIFENVLASCDESMSMTANDIVSSFVDRKPYTPDPSDEAKG